MPDAMMFDENVYMVLEPDQPEQFLSPAELLSRLEQIVVEHGDRLTPDLLALGTPTAQAQRLMNTACEFDLGPDQYLQWYVVRLEK
jgi:hypothetical protein